MKENQFTKPVYIRSNNIGGHFDQWKFWNIDMSPFAWGGYWKNILLCQNDICHVFEKIKFYKWKKNSVLVGD